ncbi:hypothetical protein QAD02_002796 [Eretmocerus hayati]|uniref:Uncharacterized protein n=1 Tax=Eretmocerus hayati TaxID=131215 RepID=A0ACC2NKA9_9HYME|nr:hypothetical protein QAD02_002796 [Eretmocerus hayati]
MRITRLYTPGLIQRTQFFRSLKSIGIFGSTIDSVLVKYGKNIVEQQYILNRLAQAAIDTYTMSVILSRASTSASKQLASADHEILMTQVWCAEASNRVDQNLNAVQERKTLDVYSKLSQISRNVCDAKGIVQTSPLDF